MCAEAHRGGISMNKFIERSYLVAFFLCAAVFLFMFATFRIDIRQRQTQEGFGEVTDYRREIVADAACPTGQKSVYTFSLGQLSDSDNSLIFFSLHQSIAVKLDGEEIYSMKPDARNAFGTLQAVSGILCVFQAPTAGNRLPLRLFRHISPPMILSPIFCWETILKSVKTGYRQLCQVSFVPFLLF